MDCPYDYGLWLFGEHLRDINRDLGSVEMSASSYTYTTRDSNENVLISDVLNFCREEEDRNYSSALLSFSPGQQSAFDTISSAIDTGRRPNAFSLQGPMGKGKTFVQNFMQFIPLIEGNTTLCCIIRYCRPTPPE